MLHNLAKKSGVEFSIAEEIRLSISSTADLQAMFDKFVECAGVRRRHDGTEGGSAAGRGHGDVLR